MSDTCQQGFNEGSFAGDLRRRAIPGRNVDANNYKPAANQFDGGEPPWKRYVELGAQPPSDRTTRRYQCAPVLYDRCVDGPVAVSFKALNQQARAGSRRRFGENENVASASDQPT